MLGILAMGCTAGAHPAPSLAIHAYTQKSYLVYIAGVADSVVTRLSRVHTSVSVTSLLTTMSLGQRAERRAVSLLVFRL